MGEETAWGMEKRHNRVTHDLVQWTGSGPIGDLGADVQLLVGEDNRNAFGLAPIPHRPMEEKCAVGKQEKFVNVTKSHVQVINNSVNFFLRGTPNIKE